MRKQAEPLTTSAYSLDSFGPALATVVHRGPTCFDTQFYRSHMKCVHMSPKPRDPSSLRVTTPQDHFNIRKDDAWLVASGAVTFGNLRVDLTSRPSYSLVVGHLPWNRNSAC